MPSVSNFQTALEGTLVTQISAAATTATVKVKEINGSTPTWLTTAHRITIIQKSRTVTKVEVVDVAAGTTQSGTTVTLGTMTRGLPLDGTGFTGSGTPQVFTSGAKVIVTWDAQAGRQTAFKDIANTFSATQTISSTNELRFADSATAIWDDGTSLSFKDSTTATKTLAQLSALSGSDEKVKITATDTTSSYLDDAILVTTPVVKTTNNGGANETITLSLDTIPVTKGGTGLTTGTTAYAPVFTGTTATGAFQAGTAGTAGQYLKSGGAGVLPSFSDLIYYSEVVYQSGTASAGVGASTTSPTAYGTHSYTITANDLVNGVMYEVIARGSVTIGAGNFNSQITLGGTSAGAVSTPDTTGTVWSIHAWIYGTTTAGAAASVRMFSMGSTGTTLGVSNDTRNTATNGTLDIVPVAKFGTSNGSNSATCDAFTVIRHSTTAA